MKELFLEITSGQIEIMYDRLKLSTNCIIKMVEDDLAFKNIFNPKKHYILGSIDSREKEEFMGFQNLLENLNNIVYFNSLLLVSFSTFEYSFKTICTMVSNHICTSKEFNDPRSSVLKKCKDYLTEDTKLIDLKRDGLHEIFHRINQVNKLRNLIAHHNGNLKEGKNNPDFEFYASDIRLSVLGSGQVFINDKEYIISFQKDSELLIQTIMLILKNRVKETKINNNNC